MVAISVPTININQLNGQLSSLRNQINFDQIDGAARELQLQTQSLQTTALGINVNEIVGGFQSLTQEIDVLPANTAIDTSEIQGILNRGVATLAANPPNLNLTPALDGSIQSSLQTITGLTTQIVPGLNVALHSLPTPEAISSALSVVSGEPIEKLQDAITSVAPQITQALASASVLANLNNGIANLFGSTVTSVTSNLNSYLNQGFSQVLKDVIQATSNPIGFVVEQLTANGPIPNIPFSVTRQVSAFIDNGNYLAAANLLQEFSNLSVSELETQLSQVSTRLTSLVDQNDFALSFDRVGRVSTPTITLGAFDGNWNDQSTTVRRPGATTSTGGGSTASGGYVFSIISSMEELEAELRGATREITETVIHWTANYIDQAYIGAEDVHEWHLARGFSGCGYHYIIKRDGSIQRGRPINIVGAHAVDFGHNRYSIGVSHVAGYNCVSGTPNPNRFISSESISDAQWRAQRNFLEVFYRVFPGGQVLGHNQCNTSGKVDPGFNVDNYILNTFGKRNVIRYANNYGPLSPIELNRARGSEYDINTYSVAEITPPRAPLPTTDNWVGTA
jgi:hypothetical protein